MNSPETSPSFLTHRCLLPRKEAETRLESRIGLRGMAIHAHYDRTFPQEKVRACLQRRESIDGKTNL